MDNLELNDKIYALRNGDIGAFEAVFEELERPVYAIIFRITRDRFLSEDILQEVFLRLYKLPPQLKIDNPRPYIFQIARNLAIDEVRRLRSCESLDEVENIVYLPVEDISVKLDIENAIKTLSLEEAQIITLHINGEMKFRDIAQIMNIPLGTALWRYQRALGKLRERLAGGTEV